jgi:hypothetical protein
MAAFRCLDPMCGLVMEAEDEGQTELCPKCGKEMEEFFPDVESCAVPSEQTADDASALARALSANPKL